MYLFMISKDYVAKIRHKILYKSFDIAFFSYCANYLICSDYSDSYKGFDYKAYFSADEYEGFPVYTYYIICTYYCSSTYYVISRRYQKRCAP